MTEMVVRQDQGDLTQQMDYSKVVAQSDLLPQAYRGKPANVLLAIGLGASMGLSQAESLYRIDVIQGTPTASAELIASNVRRAGHKLRVRIDDRAQSATATIIRADDPDYEHTVTRDMDWAKGMGLATKDNYKKQATTMLQWRAISAVARLACPEALYGVVYTPDELNEQRPTEQQPVERSGAARMRSALQASDPAPEPADAPLVDSLVEQGNDKPSEKQMGLMFALLGEAGLKEKAPALRYVGSVIDREIESRSDLTASEVSRVVDALQAESQQAPADLSGAPEVDEAEWPPVQEAPDA